MPPHLVMQAREKHSVQHVVETALGARIGAIEGKCPLLPAKPDHGAPFLHHGVFFGHEHWNFLHSHDGHTTALSMRVLARRQSQRTPSRKQPSKTLSHPTKPTLFAKPKSGLETFQLMPWKIREAGLRERRWFAAGVWAREQSFPVHSITTIQEHSHCECQAEPWPWACDKILHFAVWSCGKILSFLS